MHPLLSQLARATDALFPATLGLVVLALSSGLALGLRRFRNARWLKVLVPVGDLSRPGFRSFSARHESVRAPLRDVLAFPAALATASAVWLFFDAAGAVLPAGDDARFGQGTTIALDRGLRARGHVAENHLRLSFPRDVRIDNDFVVEVRAEVQQPARAGVVGDSVALTGAGEGEEISAGRAQPLGSGAGFDREWTLTPKKEGRRLLTLAYPASDFTPSPAVGGDPAGFDSVTVSAPGSSATRGGDGVVQLRGAVRVALPPDAPNAVTSIRFPVEVLTTLGVKKATYELLRTVCAVVVGLASLGVWKALLGSNEA